MKKAIYYIVIREREKAELQEEPFPRHLEHDQVLAKTLYSWISSGTETTGVYCGTLVDIRYPAASGYCSVSRVVETGPEVKSLKPGDIVLGGSHRSYQCGPEDCFNRIDPDMDCRSAVFIHMFKIPLPALIRTQIRGPEKCVITGLGLVGLCAAQLARMFGYEVFGFDVNPKRCKIAESYGIRTVPAVTPEQFGRSVGLGVDCSGHEKAVLELSKVLRNFGEIALVGVPWKRNTEIYAQELLHSIFYNYLSVRTGWECDMPDHHEIFNNKNFEQETMRAMKCGFLKIKPEDYDIVSPEDPQAIYQNILHGKVRGLGYMLDWTTLE